MSQWKWVLTFLVFFAITITADINMSGRQKIGRRNKVLVFTEVPENDVIFGPDIHVNGFDEDQESPTIHLLSEFLKSMTKSEIYLKIVPTIAKRVKVMEIIFQEGTDKIIEQEKEILNLLKSTTFNGEVTSNKFQKLKNIANGHGNGGPDFHSDPALDTRLTHLESQIKNIMGGVESIVTIISEVKSRQFARTFQQKGDQMSSLDSVSILNEFRRSLQDQKRKCDCKTGRVDRSERYPTDCYEIQMQGFNVSGIYKIKPDDMEAFYVLCDLVTSGGGWTVVQNRFDGSQDFYKGWNDYKNGFGNLAGEFWLGLEKLHYLTNQKLYELRVEIETQHGQEAYAVFSVFTVGPESEGYRISTLGTYYGSAGDSLSYHAGQKFSTLDSDNDEWKDGACATEHGGAWWYKECDKSNLNGKYSTSPEENSGQTMYWISFKGPNFPLMKTKMMIRPLPASRPNESAEKSRKLPESGKMKPSSGKSQKKAPSNPRSRSPYKYDNRAEVFLPNYK